MHVLWTNIQLTVNDTGVLWECSFPVFLVKNYSRGDATIDTTLELLGLAFIVKSNTVGFS